MNAHIVDLFVRPQKKRKRRKRTDSSLVYLLLSIFFLQTSVQFSLSNDGRTDLYPIQNVNAVLKKAVLAGRLSFHIPSVMDHGSSEEFSVRSIASYGAFDFLCSPATSTPVTETRATITRNPSTTITGKNSSRAAFSFPL